MTDLNEFKATEFHMSGRIVSNFSNYTELLVINSFIVNLTNEIHLDLSLNLM